MCLFVDPDGREKDCGAMKMFIILVTMMAVEWAGEGGCDEVK